MSHDSLTNFASCQSSLGPLVSLKAHLLPPTSNCPSLRHPSQHPRAMEGLSRAAPGPGKAGCCCSLAELFPAQP